MAALPATQLSSALVMSSGTAAQGQLVALNGGGLLKVKDRLLSELEPSHRFGVSRPVVRDVLGELWALGLAEARSGLGPSWRRQ